MPRACAAALLLILLMTSGVGARQETTAPAGAVLGLEPVYTYNPVGQPMPIRAKAAAGVEQIQLVLMDHGGSLLILPRTAPAGTFDLDVVLPAAEQTLRERQQVAYLQMMIDGAPVGSALILQPMLDRMVPQTEIAPHPVTKQPHTRITGWRSESEPAPPAEGAAAAHPATPGELPPRVYSGLRIYPERDVRLRTSHGDLRIALRPDEAPNTAWSFRQLVDGGFYRGVIFHRIVPATGAGDPFVIQAGDPSRSGEGGPGYWLPIEPSGLEHEFGVISMARADDPDSAGSQFFICLSRAGTARLDGQYCAFGETVGGAETILAIADVELADIARGRPVDPPVILDAQLVPAPPRTYGEGRPDEPAERPKQEQPRAPGRQPR